MVAYLVGRGFCTEDAEDVFVESLDVMLNKMDSEARQNVAKPYNYLFAIAKNRAEDFRRDHKKTSNLRLGISDSMGRDVSAYLGMAGTSEWCTFIAEELIEEFEPERSWATDVVSVAVSRLKHSDQETLNIIIEADFDHKLGDYSYKAKDVASRLNITACAVRVRKTRIYGRLCDEIRAVIKEMGIEPPLRVAHAIFEEATDIPSEDQS